MEGGSAPVPPRTRVVVEAEQDPAKAHPLTYARLGYRNLRAYLAEAGFAVSA